MTPERWHDVTEVFHAAVSRAPAERGAFLDEACAGDSSLRAQVDALLRAHERAGDSDEVPFAIEDLLPRIGPGALLGPYRVESLIGAGGMGEVYRATDTRLHRVVAVKVLPARAALDPEFRQRFEREARLLAAVSHPNIGGIHGLEEVDGHSALVLEYVEGPTLAERLERGRLTLNEALRVARQIADALEAAHARGIVHRDLKPANIKLAPGGVVKVLDFGIAKASSEAAARAAAAMDTRQGVVIGTAAYMSPEQARGEQIDRRADVWAFGCVLFEMLSGRRAFAPGPLSSSVAAILEREPDWTQLPPDLPDAIRRLLTRCLAKDPSDRLHDIADARLEIRDASAPASLTAVPRSRRHAAWIGVIALASAVAIAIWSLAPRGEQARGRLQPVQFGIRFPENLVPAHGLAVSPDGRYVAIGVYAATGQVWLYSLETSELRAVAGAERGSTPFWSPDSTQLAFFAGDSLRRLELANGLVTEICRVGGVPYGGTWNSEGLIVFGAAGSLFTVPSRGGAAGPLGLKDPPQHAGFPQFLPDGRHLLLHSWGDEGGAVHIASLGSPSTRRLTDSSVAAVFGAPDRLLYVRGTTLLAQRLNMRSLELEGDAEIVTTGAGAGTLNLPNNLGAVSTSGNGVLAFATGYGGRPGQLTWFDRTGNAQGGIPQVEGAEFLNPAISPDGHRLAVNRMDPQTGNWDVWIVDVERSAPTRVTTDAAVDADAVWSPDGKEIVFASDRGGRLALYRQPADASRPARLLHTVGDASVLVPSQWSPDGRYILYYQGGATPWSTWALPLDGDHSPLLIARSSYGARVADDGQWVAFSSSQTGSFDVYVQRFPTPSARVRLSESGGVHPRWTSGGREIVYWANPGGLRAVDIDTAGAMPRVGQSRPLVGTPVLSLIDGRTHYDASADGTRFLLRQPAAPQGPGVQVILNWTARLKR